MSLAAKNVPTIKARATRILKKLQEIQPDPKCELYFETPFQLLVSVVLSAQTTDKMVNKSMTSLYKSGFDPHTVLDWGSEGLLEKIRSIGLAPTKSKNVYRLSQLILDRHSGKIPENRADLEALPGVGRKTASVVLGELFSHPTIAVDTHVYRVTRRLGLQEATNPTKAEARLLEIIAPKFLPQAHHWFILLGRYTCKAKKPLCSTCPVASLCNSEDKQT